MAQRLEQIPAARPRQKEIIGIVGGLGPWAHIELERYLLQAAVDLLGARTDQHFPQWILSSIPQTPDRTLAMRQQGPVPTDLLVESLRRLETHSDADGREVRGADFAVVACISAHRYVGEAAEKVAIPILNMVTETARVIAGRHPGATVGLLATSGTLEDGFLHAAFRDAGLSPVSLLDIPQGDEAQRELVMETIYGDYADGLPTGGGIKGLGVLPEHVDALRQAAKRLIDTAHAEVILAGCTEIGLALEGDVICGVPLVDPMRIAAAAAVRRAYGLKPQD